MRLKSVGIFVVGVASFVLAGCGGGGGGMQSCAIYDQGSAAYLFARGAGSSQEARSVCLKVSREFSSKLGDKWSTHKNPKIDYSRDVRRCRKQADGGELDVYDKRSGLLGGLLCLALKNAAAP